jgi:hypothetical protein
MRGVVYLSGPISGVPDYKSRFAQVESELDALGYTVLSPAKLPNGLGYDQYIAIDKVLIAQSEFIVLLDGWEQSKGAVCEANYAKDIGVKIGVFRGGKIVLRDKA